MGKKKLAVIDDSQPQAEEKKEKKEVVKTESVIASEQSERESSGLSSEQSGLEAQNQDHNVAPAPRDDKKEAPVKDKKVKSSKRAQKKGKAKYRSAKYKEAAEKVEKSKRYPVTEAVDLAKQTSYSKFDGSLEIHLSTNAKNIRGLVSLPFASGKKLKILAFGKGAQESGADIVGDDAKLNEIIRGITGFDVIVTTAEWMPKLARAAKILGPRGLMPSPKNGTITSDLKKAVAEIQSGKVEYKTEKNGQVIHLSIGKVSQETDQVVQNTKILFNAIGKTRIKKAVISPSMGMGVKVDLASI